MNRTERKALIAELVAEHRRANRRVFATIKGEPVAGTGKSSNMGSLRSSAGGNNGVLSRERLLPHRYMDEGDRGKNYRRQLRRLSEAAWRREWADEQRSELEEMMSYDSWE